MAAAWYGDDSKSLILSEGGRPTDSEIEIELTYRIHLGDHLALQPDLQYVINPSGTRDVRDALVLGVRLEVGFGLF